MKNKKYHTVGTVPKSNRIILERGEKDKINKYMTAHSTGLAQALQYKWWGRASCMNPNLIMNTSYIETFVNE